MKIEKYKYKRNGEYEVVIDGEKYIIYEDIIIKNNLLAKKDISSSFLNSLLKDNKYYEAYYKSINYIKSKLRTEKEIDCYLRKNEFEASIINRVIDKLKDDKYINDDLYSKSYIHDAISFKMIGPKKIKDDLIKLNISPVIVDKNILVFDKELEYEKLDKLISKAIKSNKNKSSYMLKNKILNDMVNKGFTKSYVQDVLFSKEFDDKKIYESEYNKLFNKLSKKYSGKELELKIKQKMYQKGFRDI